MSRVAESRSGAGVEAAAARPRLGAVESVGRPRVLVLLPRGEAIRNFVYSGMLDELRREGKHAVLMRMKSGDATKFVAIPLGNA